VTERLEPARRRSRSGARTAKIALPVCAALALLCLRAAVARGAETHRKDADAETGLVAEQPTLDLGVVRQFAENEARFTLRNSSLEEIEILDLRSTCVCTAVEASRRRLGPGEQASVTAVLDTSRAMRKPQTFRIYVLSEGQDSGRRGLLELAFTVRIPARALFTPARRELDFGDVRAGSSLTKRIIWKFLGDPGGGLKSAEASAEWIDVAVTHPPNLPGAVYVNVSVLESAPQGRFEESLELSFEDENIPKQVFSIEGYVLRSIDVFPRVCFLPLAAREEAVLTLTSSTGEAFGLSIDKNPADNIQVADISEELKVEHKVKIKCPLPPERVQNSFVEFRASFLNGETEKLRVPLKVLPGPRK